MDAERDLSRLLAGLNPALDPETYVFATLDDDTAPDGLPALMLFREAEGVTLITTAEAAKAHGLDHSFPCRRITLQIHSALDAVGLIAHVADSLAKAEIASNVVSAFFHDHIFVPQSHAARALELLNTISKQSKSGSRRK